MFIICTPRSTAFPIRVVVGLQPKHLEPPAKADEMSLTSRDGAVASTRDITQRYPTRRLII